MASPASLKAIQKAAPAARFVVFKGLPNSERLRAYPPFPKAFEVCIETPMVGHPAILFERELFGKLEILDFIEDRTQGQRSVCEMVGALNFILDK